MPDSKNLNQPLAPTVVIQHELAAAIDDLTYWFVIGGQAVRCLCPYRPTRDVDFGVIDAQGLSDLQEQLRRTGSVEVIESSADTVHLSWNCIDISIFVLKALVPFVENRRLGTIGLLATKLHAILDRGTRRDFFDLYVLLQQERLGIAECLHAMREVYGAKVNDALLLRALSYFEDAEREAPLAGEGKQDWKTVKTFFLERVGNLLIPPERPLVIQANVIGISQDSKQDK